MRLEMGDSDYKYLVILFSLSETKMEIEDLETEDIIVSYANAGQLSTIGLDPDKKMDIKFGDEDKPTVVSLDLTSDAGKQYKDFARDLNLKKILGEL